jgi:hypothetical protein
VLYEKWAGFVLSNDNPLLFAHPFPVSRKIVMAAIMDFLRARRKTLNFKGWGVKKIPFSPKGMEQNGVLFFFAHPSPFSRKITTAAIMDSLFAREDFEY